ncbi:DNA-binding LytR/AlgR family response regulator [Sphingomonas kyeonggiensis]|uniref:DNA-binding LytR/AlgR family response regulator n=1 Tax=Sphingomonas kyeonggiensis TaxID=1268553 RepID=A0A7W7K326_9SPHN|nr:LytTR family DNA-binding domain-containing protein [Sphingomonas kyeonggiensis]MBB4840068.1 DNA-binding LytR/AlgR family response regulator [Sphingomonas kyeonggiensis]
MWRIPFFTFLLAIFMSPAHAQGGAWQACHGVASPAGPVLGDCRPIADVVDPQGREIWIRSIVQAPADTRPRVLYVAGVASSEAWLNGKRLGANGRPGSAAQEEIPGRYQAIFPIREVIWRDGENVLVLRLSSFHGGLRFARPMSAVAVLPYPYPPRIAPLAITFLAAGTLLAAAFGFGVIHAMRRTGTSLILAAMASVATLQAIVESLRTLFDYSYPLHAWRMSAIWVLAAIFAVLLVRYVSTRFLPGRRGVITGFSLGLVGATALLPGFDVKTIWALILGVALAALPAAAGAWRRLPGARPTLAYLTLFLALALGLPEWFTDLSYFLLAAGLVLPLLMVEVVRLGRDDRGREAALTRAASQPDRLTVASARGVELVPIAEILAVVGADDYVELRLAGGRSLLHAARLDGLASQLPAGFQRIHRSVIANLSRVQRLERDGDRWRLHLSEGVSLPVSRSRLPALREALEAPSVAVAA